MDLILHTSTAKTPVYPQAARRIGNTRQRIHRGGIISWDAARQDLLRHLKNDPTCFQTTMVDYYGLPATGRRQWPGRANASDVAFPDKARSVEKAVLQDIAEKMGVGFDQRRFLPYVMMHEFEALLFSDCEKLASEVGAPDKASLLQQIRDECGSPEEIDDSPQNAPSKRVQKLLPEFQKPVDGVLVLMEIGLPKIREECPHFFRWLSRLEQLVIEG